MTKKERSFWKAVKKCCQMEMDGVRYNIAKIAEDMECDPVALEAHVLSMRYSVKKRRESNG